MTQRTMRTSNVLKKLRAGELVNCLKLNFDSTRIVEVASMMGFDCLWVCTEHVATDWSLIEHQIGAAKMHNTDIIVRTARGRYSDYILPLELDATGIMVPHIMSLTDAKSLVSQTRFHPIGRRPWDGGNADGGYTMIEPLEYHRAANSERMVIVQIEDPEVLDDIEAIAALDGIDMLFFGPGDYSQAVGVPGQMDHPKVVEVRKRVASAAREAGKFAGTVGGLANLDTLVGMGYQFINMGSDIRCFTGSCETILQEFKKRKPLSG